MASLRDGLIQATSLPLRRENLGVEPVPGPPGVLRLGQRRNKLVRTDEDELDL